MEIKKAEYQGKTLQYLHQPDGRVRFNTNDFFDILGVNSDDYIETGEREFIDYEVALPIAYRVDDDFERRLIDIFQDYEIGSFIDGK